MTTELQPFIDAATFERFLLQGDLRPFTSAQKIAIYRKTCEDLGLNPLTRPFDYLFLNGKEILYARREATEQLRKIHNVSITITARELVDDVYVVTARATLPNGRTDENLGAVAIAGLKGETRANAMMKAETKSKRRVTLSICGLGVLDESEVESLPATATVVPPPLPDAPKALEPVEAPPTRAEPSVGAVLVTRIESKPTKKADVIRYTVHFSDGTSGTTIRAWMASLAEQCKDNQIPVRAEIETTKYGSELKKLTRADEPDEPLLEPLTDKDIPF